MAIDLAAEEIAFQDSMWVYYQNLKSHGWNHPDEGDNTKEALFWKQPNGKYGVNQIEAAWNGWKMRAAL